VSRVFASTYVRENGKNISALQSSLREVPQTGRLGCFYVCQYAAIKNITNLPVGFSDEIAAELLNHPPAVGAISSRVKLQ
jgi:hypothetical protein